MADEQAKLGSNFPLLRTTLTNNNVDFHIGVTTTDVRRAAAGTLVGSPTILTSSTANLATAFANNVRVGSTGTAPEAGLEASRRALTPGTNPGFLRGTGSVTIVYVSDEPDQSSASLMDYVRFLEGVVGTRRIQVNTIVGDPTAGCIGPGGRAAPAPRYDAVRQSFGGAFSSICDPTWSQALTDLGAPGFGYEFDFALSSPASSIRSVIVDGVPSNPGDWMFDASRNAVIFSVGAVPGPPRSSS